MGVRYEHDRAGNRLSGIGSNVRRYDMLSTELEGGIKIESIQEMDVLEIDGIEWRLETEGSNH